MAEASRLARIPSARLIRWVCGYERDGVKYPPLWDSEIWVSTRWDGDQNDLFVSFSDLMEARVIAAFSESGVQIQTVRKAIERAKSRYGIERPFSTKGFQTDGKSIFIEIADSVEDDNAYMNIVSSQMAFTSIVKPTFKDLDFQGNIATRWWPLGKNKTVVVDPSRSLGKPINGRTGVPVEALYDAMELVEGEQPTNADYSNVARLFEVSTQDVKDAIVFHEKFAA